MKRIGIITLPGYYNYGNRLQNYALQQVLKSLNCTVETIRVEDNTKITSNVNNSIRDRLKKFKGDTPFDTLKKIKQELLNKLNKYKIEKSWAQKASIFIDFSKEHIVETDFIISSNDIPANLSNQYDFFIAGSDQIWNPFFNLGSSIYFLAFAPEIKRITYAASFGFSQLPEEHRKTYKEWLHGILNLSVREDDAAVIIKDLTGKEALVHVDPTLLLKREDWIKIVKKAPEKPAEGYIFTYFLTKISREQKRKIEQISRSKKLKIINIGDFSWKNNYRTGPGEFIDYINDSIVVFTDSFHGAVFSIIFNKPFVIYERDEKYSMYSRMNTLLEKFNFKSRKSENIKTDEDVFNIDYSHVPAILQKERNRAFDYLKKSLQIKDV